MDKPEVIYRPNPQAGETGDIESMRYLYEGACAYEVTQGRALVALYHLFYFLSPGEVLADLLDLIKSGQLSGPWGEDYAVWFSGRLQVVIHQPMDAMHQRIVQFNDDRNAPPGGTHELRYNHGWPSYDQWVAEGKGDIVYDTVKYPAPWASGSNPPA